MAGLALLAITVYLLRRGRPLIYTLVPMLFMLVSALSAMSSNSLGFWADRQWLLLAAGATIFLLALRLTAEAALAIRRYWRHPVREGLDVEFASH